MSRWTPVGLTMKTYTMRLFIYVIMEFFIVEYQRTTCSHSMNVFFINTPVRFIHDYERQQIRPLKRNHVYVDWWAALKLLANKDSTNFVQTWLCIKFYSISLINSLAVQLWITTSLVSIDLFTSIDNNRTKHFSVTNSHRFQYHFRWNLCQWYLTYTSDVKSSSRVIRSLWCHLSSLSFVFSLESLDSNVIKRIVPFTFVHIIYSTRFHRLTTEFSVVVCCFFNHFLLYSSSCLFDEDCLHFVTD
jgi:hypothetical protein